jgi:selenophosphate synthase
MKAVVWAGGYSMVLGLLMGVAQAQETPQEVSTLSSIKVRAQNEKSEGTGSYQQQAVPQVLKLPMTLQEQINILCDPQTSGGLLVAVEPSATAEFLAVATELGLTLEPIGQMIAQQQHAVEVV